MADRFGAGRRGVQRAPCCFPWSSAVGLVGLLAILAAQAGRGWRYFPMLMGDHGWYLQVAWRLSRGEVLYRDVAWAYGPLPAQALAASFRWFGPDAGIASLGNAALAAAILLLTYAALRHLLRPGPALALTAFAALAGPYVGGDLIRQHLHAYTQAIAWSAALSLAAVVAALRWARTGRAAWLLASGAAAGLACLSKPEYAAAALAASAAIMAAARGRSAAWLTWLAAWGLVAGGGAAWQASTAGWQALWRGYTGYDQLALGGLWGMPGAQISLRWLLSVAAAWAAALALLVGRGRPRWRPVRCVLAVLAASAAVVLILPDLVGLGGWELLAAVRSGAWKGHRLYPQVTLQWIAAVPWSLLTPALLWASWRGCRCRQHRQSAFWWGLWAFALLANLRHTFTGYAAGLAIAPGLAVLWEAWQAEVRQDRAQPPESSRRAPRSQRGAWLGLAVLAAANLAAQPFSAGLPDRAQVIQVSTVLGPAGVDAETAAQVQAVQALLADVFPPGASIFAADWGAGWYLATGYSNRTRFDLVLPGVGGSGLDAAEVQAALAAHPPAAVILPDSYWHPERATPRRQRLAQAARAGLAPWWDGLAHDYAEVTPPEVTEWTVLVRR